MTRFLIGRRVFPKAADGFRRLLLAWLNAVLLEYCLLPAFLRGLGDTSGLGEMSAVRVGIVTLLTFLALHALSLKFRTQKAERIALAVVFLLLAAAAVFGGPTLPFSIACLLAVAAFAVYAIWGWNDRPEVTAEPKKVRKIWPILTAVFAVLFFAFDCAWTLGRTATLSSPTYDFGIFAQMFHSMKETGLPLTTLERSGLLSHFAVHVSPIYYLMLPVYCLFPAPATLQVLQAAVITSAVVPLWLIGRRRGLSGPQRMLLCLLLLLLPAFSGGTGYDLHENCFLTPLILWLLYGVERKNILLTALAAGLTLLVKEDAAVYVAVIALWLIVRSLLGGARENRRELFLGAAMFGGAVLYFLLVTFLLARFGDGVMTYRYRNFAAGDSASLMAVVRAVFVHPMKALFECVDAEKLRYLALTLLPLLGLPFLTRRYERYLLLIPYLLVNLMSDYAYQHDIFFQYGFGSTALLIYLTAINLADLRKSWLRLAVLITAAATAAAFFGAVVVPKAIRYPTNAIRYRAYYSYVRDLLDRIPHDAPVAASTFYTAELSAREIVYDLDYCSRKQLLECEYVAVASHQKDKEKTIRYLTTNGYTVYLTYENVLTIYKKDAP
ncbi:MAG: DUF2079 domain-containing protein [Ruminococcaceae bacterium]|nr:DUF2079 domain-containing protein [Oscillospiraceae bacterium]